MHIFWGGVHILHIGAYQKRRVHIFLHFFFCISVAYRSRSSHMKGGVYILCILCILCIFCIFCALISYFMSGYKLSDDEEQDIPPSQTQDLEPHDPDHPSDILHPPAPLMALPPQPQATFDFHSLSFMRKSDGKLASLFLRNWMHYCHKGP